MPSTPLTAKMARGASLLVDEDTALERFWVSISAQHDEQDAQELLRNVASLFGRQPEVDERVCQAGSLHSR